MKILHTADWHLGAQLKRERRYDEHDRVLAYLCDVIREEKIDVVLISGDIFDVFSPSLMAQGQYVHFLNKAGKAGAKKIIVVAGNHDSPTYFETYNELVGAHGVHQFGTLHNNLQDHILPLAEKDGSVSAVVLAVPYLHEYDVKQANSGESYEDIQRGIYQGIVKTYDTLTDLAKAQFPQAKIIAMGHFWALPSVEFHPEDLDLRDQMPIGAFTEKFDYFALGHIHTAGTIGNFRNARFSGSVIPMNFGESQERKTVTILDTDEKDISNVKTVELPVYQQLKQVTGNSMEELVQQLNALKEAGESVWVEARNNGPCDLSISRKLHETFDDTCVKILATENILLERENHEDGGAPDQTLDSITPEGIFQRMLTSRGYSEETGRELIQKFNLLLQAVRQDSREGGK